MAELVLIKKEDMTSIADAIREKVNISKGLTINDMVNEISAISTGIDTSDASATSNDIVSGKTAYVNGEKITGTYIPPKTTKTIYVDWSQDLEWIGVITYISNGVLETLYPDYGGGTSEIEVDGGVIYCNTYYEATNGFIVLFNYGDNNILVAQNDYETITPISTGSQDQ